MKRKTTLSALTAAAGLAAFAAIGSGQAATDATVIELTQTACQFVEAEGTDHGYSSRNAADCKTINAESGADRLAKSETLRLKPGKYIFRVTNKNVPYQLGFWLRGASIVGRATLPSVSGGGLTTGSTKDYVIHLREGEYLFSCPLNPTPDYKVIVEG